MDKKEAIQTEIDVMIHLLGDEAPLSNDAVRCWMMNKLVEIGEAYKEAFD
ncbi:hypothetical protein [Salinivibrio kushneri]|nr:hypothetical protein [Salinivibrio kushneri]